MVDAESYRTAREAAAVFDLTARSRVELQGSDRASFLHNFCTNDIKKLQAGHHCEAFLTDGHAKIQARLMVYALPQSLWIEADAGLAPSIMAHLDRYLITEDAQLFDRTEATTHFRLTGPRTAELLGNLLSAVRAGTAEQAAEYQTEPFGRLLVLPTSDLEQGSVDLVVPRSHGGFLLQRLSELGAAQVGLDVHEVLRVEAGTPYYGQDIDALNLPQEMDRDRVAISFTKGCYLGQETVARIHARGHVNRLLRGLVLKSDAPVEAGSKVQAGLEVIGAVGSSVFSPRLGAAIALAVIRRGFHTPGTEVTVQTGSTPVAAAVTPLPFVPAPSGPG